MTKSQRREIAIKKEKIKKFIIISSCALAVVILTIFIVLNIIQQGNTRIFSDGQQTVTLRGDGTFSARLFHSEVKNGKYTENNTGDTTTISFNYDGKTENGTISGENLIIPDEWDDGHGHGTGVLKLD